MKLCQQRFMLCDYYFFSTVRTFTICSLSNFQVYDMVINKDFLILAARAGIVQGPLEITGFVFIEINVSY